MIYLDNNASTPVDPEVSDAVFSALRRDYGNPSSVHSIGRKAKDTVELSRKMVAEFLGCTPSEIVFTSGGTESNNLAVIGAASARKGGHIITSAIEHPSVLNACRHLESLGFQVTYLAVDADGFIDPEDVRKSIRKNTFLITVMHANNETGVILPVEAISDIALERGITLHVDAAQTMGKMPIAIAEVRCDLLTIASHKFYGPKGIGALFARSGVELHPILFGAGHENGLRPGTENVSAIAGLGKACQIAVRDMKLRFSHTQHLRDLLFQKLRAAVPDTMLNGHPVQRLPNTLNVRIPGVSSPDLVRKIAEQVAVSSGSACHAGKQEPSRVLKAMGFSDEEALSSLRLSVGKDNTEEEILKAVEIIADAVNDARKTGSATVHTPPQ